MEDKECRFYKYLSEQFTGLDSAKIWVREWAKTQETPFGMFSFRAMAYHVSQVLEGHKSDSGCVLTCYMSTKYGSTLYWAMFDDDE